MAALAVTTSAPPIQFAHSLSRVGSRPEADHHRFMHPYLIGNAGTHDEDTSMVESFDSYTAITFTEVTFFLELSGCRHFNSLDSIDGSSQT